MFIGMCLFPWGRQQGDGVPAAPSGQRILVGDDTVADEDLILLGDDDSGPDLILCGEE